MYVWEGWMPAEITKDKRGSAKRRWDEERKLTLQTTMSYIEGKYFNPLSHRLKKTYMTFLRRSEVKSPGQSRTPYVGNLVWKLFWNCFLAMSSKEDKP